MNGIKVCLVSTVHPPDDVRIYHKQAKSLARAGYAVTLVARAGRAGEAERAGREGISLVPLKLPRGRLRRALLGGLQAYRAARREKARVYHLHDPELIAAGLLLKLGGAKVVYDVHEDLPLQVLAKPWIPGPFRTLAGRLVDFFEKGAARRFDCVVAATEIIGGKFARRGARVLVVRNYPRPEELDSAGADTGPSAGTDTGAAEPGLGGPDAAEETRQGEGAAETGRENLCSGSFVQGDGGRGETTLEGAGAAEAALQGAGSGATTKRVEGLDPCSTNNPCSPTAPGAELEPFQLVYLGSISVERGIEEMLKALTLLPAGRPVRLVLGGDFVPPALAEEVKSMDGWERVDYRGRLDRAGVAAVLRRSGAGLALMQPRQRFREALPIKLFEYMAAGLPVIASAFPRWREIVEGSRCGFCVDPENPAAAAEAISTLIERPAEAAEMGRRGQAAVAERYNWAREEARLLQRYRELTS